jgi:hypothetical protein
VALNRLDTAYLQRLDPDVISIHTASTLRPFLETTGDTIEASLDFIDQHLSKKLAWQEIQDPVKRAPYVAYEVLRNIADKCNLVFARYGEEFSHLYAVKKMVK